MKKTTKVQSYRVTIFSIIFLCLCASLVFPFADGDIATVAGNGTKGFSGDGGPAAAASLDLPEDTAVDSAGNLFIADSGNSRIRRVDAATGIIVTVAGNGTGGFDGDGGPAAISSLNFPEGLTVDGAGNLFIADSGNNRIRRVDAMTGIIATVAGNGKFGFSGDGGPATSASLNLPEDVAVDGAGNLFIADTFNNRIRRVDTTTGIITTFAGNGKLDFIGDGGPATSASLNLPEGLTVDGAGNLFVADTSNDRIRRIDAKTGIITTIAGNGTENFSGDGGPATSAGLNLPENVAVDGSGNLFIADTESSRIRRVDTKTGIITTVAGNGKEGFSGDGGSATNASLNFPESLAIDRLGNLFIVDTSNNAIRSVKGIAGGGGQAGDFALTINPASQTVLAGASTNFTVNVQAMNGFTQPVSLSAVLNPASSSITVSFSPSSVTPGSSALMNISTTASAQATTFNITVTGRSVQLTHSQTVTLIVTAPSPNPGPTITGASFTKPNLSITGTGFGSSGAMVSVNGREIGSLITNQTDTAIALKGNKKKLNLKKGSNQITVTVGGITSNTFVLNL